MTENAKNSNAPEKKRAPTLYFIVAIKLTKGALLLAIAIWFFVLARQDLPELFDRFLRWMDVDPEKRFFANIGDWLDTLTPGKVQAAATVALYKQAADRTLIHT